MKGKKSIFILAIIVLSILFVSCTKAETEEKISIKEVSSIEIVIDDNEDVIVYTASENENKTKEFIKAFNEGEPWATIEKVTPNTKFTIFFKDGTAITTMQ